jgi:hypothetical protein
MNTDEKNQTNIEPTRLTEDVESRPTDTANETPYQKRSREYYEKAEKLGLKTELGLDELKELGMVPEFCDGGCMFSCLSCPEKCGGTQEHVNSIVDDLCGKGLSDDLDLQCLCAFVEIKRSTSCLEAYEAYCRMCYQLGIRAVNERAVGKAIAANFSGVERTRIRINGMLTYVYKGLAPRYDMEGGKEFFERISVKRKAKLGFI